MQEFKPKIQDAHLSKLQKEISDLKRLLATSEPEPTSRTTSHKYQTAKNSNLIVEEFQAEIDEV